MEEPTFAGQVKTIRISCPSVDTVLQAIGWHSPKTPVRSSWIPLDLGGRIAGFVLSCKLVFYFIVGGMKNLRGPCIKSSFTAHISILERQITLTFVLILGWSLLALDILLDLSSFLIPCLRDLLYLWVHLLSPLGKMYCFFCLLFLIIDVF